MCLGLKAAVIVSPIPVRVNMKEFSVVAEFWDFSAISAVKPIALDASVKRL
jgi:hypothetical protein